MKKMKKEVENKLRRIIFNMKPLKKMVSCEFRVFLLRPFYFQSHFFFCSFVGRTNHAKLKRSITSKGKKATNENAPESDCWASAKDRYQIQQVYSLE